MRDKLIELIGSTECGNGSVICKKYQDGFIAKIADNLLVNGVIAPPCKVGDVVYTTIGDCETPCFVDEGTVFAISVDAIGMVWVSVQYECGLKYYHTHDDIGETVFLSREEAEAALKEGK